LSALQCYHKWKFYAAWCNCCGEFDTKDNTHGEPISQCTKCGILWGPEYSFLSKEEIENLISLKVKFPETEIEIKGV